ncbi:putative quinol monooxygenase [Bradyrhizobium septentrionale]|uniref:Antibiotic biosynthesis monooxygenase n=1 Tax=Bradyrhizobium septentrionale TaxID=1404411 RepID=A0A973W0K5_9BRAD|nr:putative quinol monooxygenase [Bradyrhizobium septentrionale]UGY14042.1 antibiotic biosynthesis monooxygenase [Bradyrhizobium septentrionale]UGY22597.1 antibiotic biosynthesis monooxygenase [Bradyrhizobium septentrionale]
MLTITAVIRAKQDHEATMRQALLDVVDHVRANEPSTIGYYVSQDASDPCVFATYERYPDQAAMDRHNNSPAVARFFDIARPILDGDVILVSANEIASKGDAK